MFLDGERSRVQGHSENLDVGSEGRHGSTHWEGQKLSDDSADRNGGEPEEEELVQARYNDRPCNSENPGTEGRDWHVGIVGIGNGRPDLGVWTLVIKANVVLVQVGVIKHSSRQLLVRWMRVSSKRYSFVSHTSSRTSTIQVLHQ